IGEELVHLRLAYTRLAARVRVRPQACNDVVDDPFGRLIASRVGGHDAVAVEGLGREYLCRRRRLFNGNVRSVLLVQDLPSKTGDQLAFSNRIVDRPRTERG